MNDSRFVYCQLISNMILNFRMNPRLYALKHIRLRNYKYLWITGFFFGFFPLDKQKEKTG